MGGDTENATQPLGWKLTTVVVAVTVFGPPLLVSLALVVIVNAVQAMQQLQLFNFIAAWAHAFAWSLAGYGVFVLFAGIYTFLAGVDDALPTYELDSHIG